MSNTLKNVQDSIAALGFLGLAQRDGDRRALLDAIDASVQRGNPVVVIAADGGQAAILRRDIGNAKVRVVSLTNVATLSGLSHSTVLIYDHMVLHKLMWQAANYVEDSQRTVSTQRTALRSIHQLTKDLL